MFDLNDILFINYKKDFSHVKSTEWEAWATHIWKLRCTLNIDFQEELDGLITSWQVRIVI